MIQLENSTVRRDVRSYEWDRYDLDLGYDDEDEEVFEEDEIDEF